MPACPPCNNSKSNINWEQSPQVQLVLQKASEKAPAAQEAAEKVLRNQDIGKALNTLLRAQESGALTSEIVAGLGPVIEAYTAGRSTDSDPYVVRLAPGVTSPLYEVIKDDGFTRVVRGPYGVGGGPSPDTAGALLGTGCSSCGFWAFNGTRCVICGQMDDGD